MQLAAATLGHGVAGASRSGLAAAAKAVGCRQRELLCVNDGSSTIMPCDDVEAWPEEERRKLARLQTSPVRASA